LKNQFRQALLVLLIFVILAAVHLFINTQNIGLKYKVTDLKIKLGALRSQRQMLGAQVAGKENPALIEKYAVEKLGMATPADVKYILP
jgi:cell division protein FtsB